VLLDLWEIATTIRSNQTMRISLSLKLNSPTITDTGNRRPSIIGLNKGLNGSNSSGDHMVPLRKNGQFSGSAIRRIAHFRNHKTMNPQRRSHQLDALQYAPFIK
jgi:hypothetical protein